MTTPNPFPEGLTADAWHSLNFRLQNGEPDLANGWAVRESDLIAIGVLTGPESHTLPGWTRKAFRYNPNTSTHLAQLVALQQWAQDQVAVIRVVADDSQTQHVEAIYFRDTDGKSAPSDATDLVPGGWKLFTGAVIGPLNVLFGGTADTAPPDDLLDPPGETGDAVTVKRPADDSALRPLRVGDRVPIWVDDDTISVGTVARIIRIASGRSYVLLSNGVWQQMDNGARVVSEEGV
jgi:hypothetical protein